MVRFGYNLFYVTHPWFHFVITLPLLVISTILTLLDERPELCNICPKTSKWYTYPRVGIGVEGAISYSLQATYSCKHKVTGRPICTIPCNGYLELCENDADEQCQGLGLAGTLAVTSISAAIFLVTALVVSKIPYLKGQMSSKDMVEYDVNEHSSFLHVKMLYHVRNKDYKRAQEMVRKYYNIEVLGSLHYMEDLGTNDLTTFLHDFLTDSFTIKCACALHHYVPRIFEVWRKWNLERLWLVAKCVVSLSLRYSDISKDILLIYIIWLQWVTASQFGSFLFTILCLLVSSLVSFQILNLITIAMHEEILSGKKVKLGLAMVATTPLMPAFYMYKNLINCLDRLDVLDDGTKEVTMEVFTQRLMGAHAKIHRLDLLSAKLKSNENVLGALVQSVILFVIISLSHSASGNVGNFEVIYVNKNSYLSFQIVALSLMSLVMGQVQTLQANRDGCLTGIFIIIPYFFVGTASRLVERMILVFMVGFNHDMFPIGLLQLFFSSPPLWDCLTRYIMLALH